ncbi:MAG: bacterial transcriptional activator domain-containing protein, partial [Burkholderiaceae bacterium]|nr:bacterial transcriptional activator domain-containing protein [Burkholderiaceae bacterium]
GELFPEDRYADWAVLPREQLAEAYLRALLAAAEERLSAGRPADALDACRRALALDPWQEQAVLLGMRACVALGDRAAALRLYRNLERTLREELGIAPENELRRLYESLRAP